MSSFNDMTEEELESQFNKDTQGEQDPDGSPPNDDLQVDGEGGDAGEPGDGVPAADSGSPARHKVLDRELEEAEVKALIEFYDFARNNPQQIQVFDQYLRGELQIVPKEQQDRTTQGQNLQETDTDTDEDDEFEGVPERLKQEILQLRNSVGAVEAAQAQERLAVAQAAVQKGKEAFQSRIGLDDEEIDELEAITAEMGILPRLMEQSPDMLTAVERALDTALWSTEKFRERALSAREATQRRDQERQRRAGSLSGSSASAPRNQSEPSNPQERQAAFAAAISEAMNGKADNG